MALAGMTGGRLALRGQIPPAPKQFGRSTAYIAGGLSTKQAAALALDSGRPLHDALMTARGWPEIQYDGRLLVTHQDALLMGGKVQAMPGFADHVVFLDKKCCLACERRPALRCVPGRPSCSAMKAASF